MKKTLLVILIAWIGWNLGEIIGTLLNWPKLNTVPTYKIETKNSLTQPIPSHLPCPKGDCKG